MVKELTQIITIILPMTADGGIGGMVELLELLSRPQFVPRNQIIELQFQNGLGIGLVVPMRYRPRW